MTSAGTWDELQLLVSSCNRDTPTRRQHTLTNRPLKTLWESLFRGKCHSYEQLNKTTFKKTEESICEVLKTQTKKFISIRLHKQLYSSFCVLLHPLWTRRSVPVLECQTLLVRNKHKRDDQTEQLIHPPTHTNLYTPLTHSQEITGCLAFVSFHFLKACLPAFLSVRQKH